VEEIIVCSPVGIGLLHITQMCPKLNSWRVCKGSKLLTEQLITIILKNPNIVKFEFTYHQSESVDSALFLYAIQLGRPLESLIFSHRLTDASLDFMVEFSKFPESLKVLKIPRANILSEEKIITLLTHFPNLNSLDVSKFEPTADFICNFHSQSYQIVYFKCASFSINSQTLEFNCLRSVGVDYDFEMTRKICEYY
jgi:hypothetical protein